MNRNMLEKFSMGWLKMSTGKKQVGSSTKNSWVSGNRGKKARHVNDAGLLQGCGLLDGEIIFSRGEEGRELLTFFLNSVGSYRVSRE